MIKKFRSSVISWQLWISQRKQFLQLSAGKLGMLSKEKLKKKKKKGKLHTFLCGWVTFIETSNVSAWNPHSLFSHNFKTTVCKKDGGFMKCQAAEKEEHSSFSSGPFHKNLLHFPSFRFLNFNFYCYFQYFWRSLGWTFKRCFLNVKVI